MFQCPYGLYCDSNQITQQTLVSLAMRFNALTGFIVILTIGRNPIRTSLPPVSMPLRALL